jgi:hypothetical protein
MRGTLKKPNVVPLDVLVITRLLSYTLRYLSARMRYSTLKLSPA